MAKKSLNVFLYGVCVGQLYFDQGRLSFCYGQDYLALATAFSLSASLPLREKPFDHDVVDAFFSGLLPDGEVRRRLARILKVTDKNTFALLDKIGGECAGAISLLSPEITFRQYSHRDYRFLSDDQAETLLSQLDRRPLLIGEEGLRVSGAGAQHKMMVAFVDGKMALPINNTPSTHILKPAIHGLDFSVHNEFFCMKLAARVGLNVPHVFIYDLKHRPYYCVERYDRLTDKKGKVSRMHQEDFCQALGVSPLEKYENEGGPTLKQCFTILDQKITSGHMAGKNKINFFKSILFNFFIGNGDAHGKNYSLLYDGESESLAPLYDLMCTQIYDPSLHKSKMAMKLGGVYHFKAVRMMHVLCLAEEIGFREDFTRNIVHNLMTDILGQAELLCDELNQDRQTKSAVYQRICHTIQQRVDIFQQG